MSLIYIHENLVNIQPLFTKYCADKDVWQQGDVHQNEYVPLPLSAKKIILPLSGTTKDHAVWSQNLLG